MRMSLIPDGSRNGRRPGHTSAARRNCAALFLAAGLLSACADSSGTDMAVDPEESEELESESAAELLAEETETAEINGAGVIRSGGRLYFRYRDTFYELTEEDSSIRSIVSLEGGEKSSSFWIYRGGFYFDMEYADDIGDGLTGLYRLDLTDGSTKHMADLNFVPTSIYVSKNRLYARNSDSICAYDLDDQGLTEAPVSPENTIYGKIPAECLVLPKGETAYAAEHLGYLPLLDGNDLTLIVADADGSNPRRLGVQSPDAYYCGKDRVYTAFRRDGSVVCEAYDVNSDRSWELFTADAFPRFLEEDGGYLYYSVQSDEADTMSAIEYYRIPADGGESELCGRVEAGPAMGGYQPEIGIFEADGDTLYYPVYNGMSICFSRQDMSSGGSELLTPVLETSRLASLGEASASSGTAGSEPGNASPGIEWYAETITFSGGGSADKMSQTMAQAAAEAESYASELYTRQQESAGPGSGANDLAGLAGVTSVDWRIDGESGVTWLTDHYCCIRGDGRLRVGDEYQTWKREYFVFDRDSGSRLTLADVTSTSESDLRELVAEAFARLETETSFSYESPEELKKTVRGKISYSSPFYLTDEGVVFYFEPGEISPEIEGYPEVTIPWRSLKIRLLR